MIRFLIFDCGPLPVEEVPTADNCAHIANVRSMRLPRRTEIISLQGAFYEVMRVVHHALLTPDTDPRQTAREPQLYVRELRR